jgi:hypothetical protein
VQQVYNSSVVTLNELKSGLIPHNKPVRLQYNTKDNYKLTAKMLGLMDDFKVKNVLIVFYRYFMMMVLFCRVECLVLATEASFPFSTTSAEFIWHRARNGSNMTRRGASTPNRQRPHGGTISSAFTNFKAKCRWLLILLIQL